MARKTVLQNLIDLVNVTNGKVYPDVGYVYYACYGGYSSRKLWVIVNEGGGVTLSYLNRETLPKTRGALRGYIMQQCQQNGEPTL